MSLTLPPVDREALVATRRDLHEHPELGFQETRTSTLVADRLKSLGYQVKTGVGRTGVVAVKAGRGGGGGPVGVGGAPQGGGRAPAA
jgi:amidohydrolase